MSSSVDSRTTSVSPALTTPAERRRQRVREAILDAAERVFAEDGLEGLSIRRLADEVDYSPSAIYKYFASKTELVSCLKEAFFERLILRIDSVMAEGEKPFEERVKSAIQSYIDTALEKPHHYVAAFSGTDMSSPDIAEDGESIPDVHDEVFQDTNRVRAFNMLHDQVTGGVEAGIFRSDLETNMAAKSLWASMHGLAVLMIHMPGFSERFPDGQSVSSEAFLSFHSEQLVRGLK